MARLHNQTNEERGTIYPTEEELTQWFYEELTKDNPEAPAYDPTTHGVQAFYLLRARHVLKLKFPDEWPQFIIERMKKP
jgi:6-pyruvoyl-tetrahydropterin synthase